MCSFIFIGEAFLNTKVRVGDILLKYAYLEIHIMMVRVLFDHSKVQVLTCRAIATLNIIIAPLNLRSVNCHLQMYFCHLGISVAL